MDKKKLKNKFKKYSLIENLLSFLLIVNILIFYIYLIGKNDLYLGIYWFLVCIYNIYCLHLITKLKYKVLDLLLFRHIGGEKERMKK